MKRNCAAECSSNPQPEEEACSAAQWMTAGRGMLHEEMWETDLNDDSGDSTFVRGPVVNLEFYLEPSK